MVLFQTYSLDSGKVEGDHLVRFVTFVQNAFIKNEFVCKGEKIKMWKINEQ
jgi:hypothetical protein